MNKKLIWLSLAALFCLTQFNCGGGGSTVIVPSIRDFTVVDQDEAWLLKQDGELLIFNHDGRSTAETHFAGRIVQIYFLNMIEGWVLEENGQFWATADHGRSWQKKALLPKYSPSLYSEKLVFADRETGWFLGSFNISMTPDGGNSWATYPTRRLDDNADGRLMSISAVDSNTVWLGFERSGLLRTLDRGRTWEKIKAPARIAINTIYASSADECFVSGRGDSNGLFHTTDGGKTWKDVLTPEMENNLGINSISFVDQNTGWAAGLNFVTDINKSSPDIDVLLKTVDGGKTWVKVETGIIEKHGFSRVRFADQNNGWLTGDRSVYRTVDGGTTWIKVIEVEDYNDRFR